MGGEEQDRRANFQEELQIDLWALQQCLPHWSVARSSSVERVDKSSISMREIK